MCGIYGIAEKRGKKPVERVLLGLKRLEYRGYDSFGVGVRMNGGGESSLLIERFLGAPSAAVENSRYKTRLLALRKKVGNGSLVVGHTRWATHGGVNEKNAHPQRDASGRVLVVLNGIIENYSELRLELEKKHGVKFRSETDTEVIPQLIGMYMSKNGMSFEDAALQTARRLAGRFAFVAMEKDSDFLLCFRDGSPLVIGRSNEGSFVSSDPAAFGDGVEEAYFLESGEYARIGDSGIKIGFFRNENDKAFPSRHFSKLGDIAETVTKEGYPHFMLKEIMEQENALRRAMNQDDSMFLEAAKCIREAKGVYLVGCGTAANVSKVAREWFADIAGVQVSFSHASQFARFYRFIGEGSVVVAVSQSGETADVLEVAEKCKERGAKLITVVNTESSSLARMSEHVLPIKAGAEVGVAATKTALCQLAVLHLLVSAVADDMESGRSLLSLTAHAMGEVLVEEYLKEIKNISAKFSHVEHLYVLGRGSMYPVALEGALKIKEISYIHAEGFDAGELKHGPIALIEKGTPVLALVPHDETKADILNNLSEVRARGALVIGISSVNHPHFDEWIPITDVGAATPLLAIVPLQMFAYFLAILRKKNPDKPRNLAKSVTVK
jgi:glucosamine--fructose-6-phosphate aminotransferase (isomerizing)